MNELIYEKIKILICILQSIDELHNSVSISSIGMKNQPE